MKLLNMHFLATNINSISYFASKHMLKIHIMLNILLYISGVSVPRIHSVTGSLLPSTRLVSNFIHGSGVSDLLEPGHSAMLMQWGQLLSHDFIDSPTIKGRTLLYFIEFRLPTDPGQPTHLQSQQPAELCR